MSGVVRFARTAESVGDGVHDDLVFHATIWLVEEGLPPNQVGFKLNGIPFSMLAAGSGSYDTPREAMKKLAERSTSAE